MDRTGADFFASVPVDGRSPWSCARTGADPDRPGGSARRHRRSDRDARRRLNGPLLGENFEVVEIPAELAEQAHVYHHLLIDRVAEFDDELMETYVEDEESVTPEMLRRALNGAR